MTDPPESGVIRVFGLEDSEAARIDRRPFQRRDDLRLGWGEVPVAKLRKRVETFLANMHEVLADLPDKIGEYHLEQVQVSAEVSAKGQVSLLGTGGELAGKSGLTFTFKLSERKEPETNDTSDNGVK
jgi:hypothetical protein